MRIRGWLLTGVIAAGLLLAFVGLQGLPGHAVTEAPVSGIQRDVDAAVAVFSGSIDDGEPDALIAEAREARDPAEILARAEQIDDPELRRAYLAAAVAALAESRPELAFELLEAIDSTRIAGLPRMPLALIRHDPERALRLAGRYPDGARLDQQMFAIQILSAEDPAMALARSSVLPPGAETGALLYSIAETLARSNPDSALAWAQLSRDSFPGGIAAVLLGLAETDAGRAVEILTNELGQQGLAAGAPALAAAAGVLALSEFVDPASLADQLLDLESDSGGHLMGLQAVLASWGGEESAAAIDWVIANQARVDEDVAGQFAYQLARQNPAAALGVLEISAAAEEGPWLAGAAAGLATSDPDAARQLVDSYRGEAAFASGMRELVDIWAEIDPVEAAQMLIEIGESSPAPQTVARIAASWGARDPGGASVWLMGYPSGPPRDAGVASLLLASARQGAVDTDLVSAFSSDEVRQQGMVNVILELGMEHPDEAAQLMRAQISDPRLRQLVETELERTGGSGGTAPYFVF